MSRRRRSGKSGKIRWQSVQVIVSVQAPPEIQKRITHQLLQEAVELIALGETIPGITVKAVIWHKDAKEYYYVDEDAQDALRKAIRAFGSNKIRYTTARQGEIPLGT